MKLEERKEQENLFKSNLNQISRGRFKSKEQKSPSENIELFRDHKMLLLNYLMNVLQLYLWLNTKQNMEKDSKY